MRIDRVIYKNYCQHEDRNDVLGAGVIGVIGGNGKGKSNWLKGILRAFTGKTINAGKNEDDVSWGADKGGSVEVFFSAKDIPGRIKRDLKTSRCSMDFGDKKFKSAKEIDGVIFEMLGVSPKLMQDVVFVQQGMIEQILFQRASDRARALQSLFGTEHAEKIRGLLQDELTNCVINSRADTIKELAAQKGELEAKLKVAVLAKNDQDGNTLKPEAAAKLNTMIQSASNYRDAKEKLSLKERELADNRGQYNDANKLKNEKEGALEALEGILVELRPIAETSRKSIANYDILKSASEQHETREARIGELNLMLTKEPPEDPEKADFTELADKSQAYAERKPRLEAWKKFLASFHDTAAALNCPMCLQPVSPEYAGAIDKAAKDEEPELDALDQEIQFQQTEQRHMQAAFEQWKDYIAAAQTELDTLQRQSTAAPGAKLPSESEISDMKAMLESFESSEKTAMSLKQEIAVQTERSKNMFRAVTNVSVEVDKLNSRLKAEPNAAEVEKAQESLTKHEAARIEAARLAGEITQLEERFSQVETMLGQREAEEKQLDGLKSYRTLCDRARTVLHRDNLPNMVAQAYMKALNNYLAHYLDIFNVPYRARMMPDTSVVCTFGSQEVPAERLSGGQRVSLGLTWRFAVHNLFVNSLGLMILDEPTVFLDKDRVDSVYQLLEQVKSYSKAAGLQLIVVTHEERLSGVFDQVIQL